MSIVDQIENEFCESLALIILHGNFTNGSEYQKGFLAGYARAYTQMTGKTMYQLIAGANKMIEGSGRELHL